jgi:hypothetical protein
VACVAAIGQRVVEVAENLDGLDVDRVFLAQAVLLVARDEGEFVNVLVQVLERKLGFSELRAVKSGSSSCSSGSRS